MTLGERIKELRMERNLKQYQLAKKAGVQIATMVNIERDKIAPRFCTLEKVAKGLNVSISTMFVNTEHISTADVVAVDANANKIIVIYNQLPAGDKHALLRYAEFLNMEQEECPQSNNGKH